MQQAICPPLDRPWTEAEGFAVVAEWRRSGLAASEFCRGQGIGLHRLRYWAGRESRSQDRAGDFVVVPLGTLDGDEHREAESDELVPMLEIHLAQGVLVRVPITAGRDVLVGAIRAVLEVAT